MAKSRVHYFVVKATFDRPISAADAKREVRNIAALSYEEHYTDDLHPGAETFKLKPVNRKVAQ